MPTTTSLGVGAGLDLQSMLTKLMAAERAPIDVLTKRIASTNTQISVYGTLNSKLDVLKSAAETLQFPSRLSAVTATSSDTTVLDAKAVFTAATGSYGLEVTQLAAAQKNVSMGYVAGTTFSGGDITFTVGGNAAPTITLDPGSYTLAEVSTKINDAKLGVTATVVNTTGGGQRLILTSDKSGTANAFSLTSTLAPSDDAGPPVVVQASLATADPTKGTVAKNATMKLDGIDVSSSSNQFTDTVTGMTFTAVKLGTATVTVQNDSTKITAAVKAFVDAYNDVATTIKTNSGYNAATKTGQAFTGDATARGVLDTLGNARTTVPTELSAATYKALSDLGVTVLQTGQLSLDSAQLAQKISTSSTDVIQTLSAYGKSFAESVAGMQTSGGMVSNRVDSLNASVKSFKSNQEVLEYRIALIEKRYRAQFTSLDTFVSRMQSLSGSLTQSLGQKSSG
jgi:flagellar hook-associated protein 2